MFLLFSPSCTLIYDRHYSVRINLHLCIQRLIQNNMLRHLVKSTCVFSYYGIWTLNAKYLYNITGCYSRLLAVEADSARSAGSSVACNDFILTAYVHNMTWGVTWHVTNWTWTARWRPRATWLGSGRKTTVRQALPSSPERTTPSSPKAAALGLARACWENSKPGRTLQPKINGGLTTGECWAPRQFTRKADLIHCTLDILLGACMGLEGERVHGGSTLGRQWAAESEQGPSDCSVLNPTGSSPG
jgi:hypothetical protein